MEGHEPHKGFSMVPFFQSDSLTVYHGNAFTILPLIPSGSVDAVITDPPYCSGAATLSAKQADPVAKYQGTGTKRSYPPMPGDAKDQRSFTWWMTQWLCECWRIARDGAPILVFTDWRQLPSVTDAVQAAGFSWRSIVVWCKPSARPILGEFQRDSEFIVYGCKGRLQRHSTRCLPGVYRYPVNAAEKVHITSKPIPLMTDLMGIVPEGGTVLDPFLGGGSTALAAKATGRKCIGIELSQEYARITAERASAA